MTPFVGQLMLFAGNFAPRGFALCDGQLLPIAQYSALFSILGTTYGGDGKTTFALPDLRGRVPMGMGHGPGLSMRSLGSKVGSETNTLTSNEMPSHSHAVNCVDGALSTEPRPGGHFPGPENAANANVWNDGPPDNTMAAGMIANAGGGQPVNNMQPSLTVNWCIALEGIYPSRD